MYGYIYLTINKVNHKTYVGQKMLKNKNWDKDGYLGSGKLLKCAIKKYGKENFEKFLVQFCYSKEELDKQEIFWISEYRKRGLAQYNIANGGEGCCIKGRTPWNKGKTGIYSDETKKKMSETHKGKQLSEDTRYKMSETHKGKQLSEDTRYKMSETHKGKQRSEDTRYKISEAHKGKPGPNKGKHWSEETKKKMSETNKGKHWYSNGKISKFCYECPPGFVSGRIYFRK